MHWQAEFKAIISGSLLITFFVSEDSTNACDGTKKLFLSLVLDINKMKIKDLHKLLKKENDLFTKCKEFQGQLEIKYLQDNFFMINGEADFNKLEIFNILDYSVTLGK